MERSGLDEDQKYGYSQMMCNQVATMQMQVVEHRRSNWANSRCCANESEGGMVWYRRRKTKHGKQRVVV